MIYHSGARIQRGRGIGSILSGLFRTVLPAVSRAGLRTAKRIVQSDVAKDIGRQMKDVAARSAVNMALDTLDGQNVGESLQNQLNSAKRDISSTLRKSIARKRSRTNKSNSEPRRKKSRYGKNRIFSEIKSHGFNSKFMKISKE